MQTINKEINFMASIRFNIVEGLKEAGFKQIAKDAETQQNPEILFGYAFLVKRKTDRLIQFVHELEIIKDSLKK